MTAETKAQPSRLPAAGSAPKTLFVLWTSVPPPSARTTDQISRTKTVAGTMVEASMKGFRYRSGLNHSTSRQEMMKMTKAVKSPVSSCFPRAPYRDLRMTAKGRSRTLLDIIRHTTRS